MDQEIANWPPGFRRKHGVELGIDSCPVSAREVGLSPGLAVKNFLPVVSDQPNAVVADWAILLFDFSSLQAEFPTGLSHWSSCHPLRIRLVHSGRVDCVWAVLWIVFPVFVYYQLNEPIKLQRLIERNTRR
jgi:hypothetical protein